MTNSSNSNADWNDCPRGEISHLVQSLKKRRQRKTFQQAVGVTAGIACVVLLLSSALFHILPGQDNAHSISCKKVHELAPLYVSHQLDEETSDKITRHLKVCEKCQGHYREEFPRFPLPVVALTPWNPGMGPIAVLFSMGL